MAATVYHVTGLTPEPARYLDAAALSSECGLSFGESKVGIERDSLPQQQNHSQS